MTTVQKWLTGLIALGALYLVTAPNSHIASALNAATGFVSGTQHTTMTGQVA